MLIYMGDIQIATSKIKYQKKFKSNIYNMNDTSNSAD